MIQGAALLLSLVVLVVSEDTACTDLYPRSCRKWQRKGYCSIKKHRPALQTKCRRSCNFCEESTCFDLAGTTSCEEWLRLGLCTEGKVSEMCALTCGGCSSEDPAKCQTLSIEHGYFVSKGNSKKSGNLKMEINGVSTAGGEVRIQCEDGYQLMGNDKVRCLSHGVYDGKLGVCIRKNECEVPEFGSDRYFLVSESMSLNSNEVSPGTYAILVCLRNGRKMKSFCSSFGTWLPALRDCYDDTAKWSRWYEDNNISSRHIGGAVHG